MTTLAQPLTKHRLCLVLLTVLMLPMMQSCRITTNGMVSGVQQFRVGVGSNDLGIQESRQYYILWGLFRLNEVNTQRTVADLTSYDITTGSTFSDWLMSIILFPLSISRTTVKVQY